MANQFLNPQSLMPTNGWTHIVSTSGGKTIYISGQVSVDERGQVVGKGDLKAQTEKTFANLDVALKAAGASFRDVVKMNIYVVGLKAEQVPIVREVRARYVNMEAAPASTFVGIAALVWAARRDRQDPVFRSADERRRQDRERKEEVERAARQRL